MPGVAAAKRRRLSQLEGYTLLAEFKAGADSWKVYEDLRTREGSLVFLSSSGKTRVLTKSAEASMLEGIPYLGLALKDIGLSSPDLLADRLLQDGDPDPERVKSAAPPMASADKNPRTLDHVCRHERSLRRYSGLPQWQHADVSSDSIFTRFARGIKEWAAL